MNQENNEKVQDLLKSVSDSVAKATQSHIGQEVSEDTMLAISKSVSEIVKQTCQVESVKSASAWSLMTLSDRIKWFLVFRVFPGIGDHLEKVTFLASCSNGEVGQIQTPRWAFRDPKQVVIASVLFTPPVPVKYLTSAPNLTPERETFNGHFRD